MKTLLTLSFALFSVLVFGQQPTQTVRGTAFDVETEFPLIGVTIQIFTADSTLKLRAKTDIDGNYSISNVPVGKHELVGTYMTYDAKSITIEVNSGKQSIYDLPMQESILDHEEVVVSARKKGAVINEMALLSAQQFSVSETDRYPGSRSDPARMASNFAGVGGADDSRNDIVIRGNSPLGVVYKVEGIDIPNPSHFAIAGSTGGPVSIINNKILGNSDFFMSAFPAEYGNSTSGIFDLKLRQGNNKQHEFTGQFGLLGTELMAEGPLGKSGKSSYIAMGRYSTLSLFKVLGLQLGTDAIPVYGDGAFKFNWKLNNGGQLSLWAIGGSSDIDIVISEQDPNSQELYGENDRDQYFGTTMAVGGLSYKQPLSEKTFITATLAYSQEIQRANHDYLQRSVNLVDSSITVDSIYPLMGYKFSIGKASGHVSVNHKLNKRHLIKAGINLDGYIYNMDDSVQNVTHTAFVNRWDYQGYSALIQPFIQWKWRINEKMDFTAGLHAQYFSLSNSVSYAEPRVGWRYRMKNGHTIFAGGGMHSQTQPQYTYLYHQFDSLGNKQYHNIDMDFMRSVHSGLGYEKAFKNSLNLKFEAYYQYLYNVPVTIAPSSFSLINMGSGFARFFPEPLQNTGTGENYGIELTLQKYFDRSFFFLFSGTLYDSKYVGSDGVKRNTSYNGNYIANLLGGKEFKLGPKQSISLGLKITYAGGKRYGLVDVAATNTFQEIVFQDSLFNDLQFQDYFRIDAKVNWKFNAKRATHEIGLDLVNITNRRNLLSLTYAPNLFDPSAEPVAERYQLGFLPIFYYKIDFRFGKKE